MKDLVTSRLFQKTFKLMYQGLTDQNNLHYNDSLFGQDLNIIATMSFVHFQLTVQVMATQVSSQVSLVYIFRDELRAG